MTETLPRASPAGPARLRAAEATENFPVALRVLPARHRTALRAVYEAVRTIDDLADEDLDTDPDLDPGAEGETARAARRTGLDAVAADLDRAWSGHPPRLPALAGLAALAAAGVPRAPFDDLLEANRRDLTVTRYPDRAALLDYCRLSAVPIGRLVLAVFEVDADAELLADADAVCVALQILEHLQDLAEDRRRGRVYLPADTLAAAGVDAGHLDHPSASFALRRVVRDEAERAASLLAAGPRLVARLDGPARPAVAGYVAGGLAAADAIRRTGGDVLGLGARTRRRDVARHAAGLLRPMRAPVDPDPDVAAAYHACEQITREQARNFHYGIRLLPPARRAALCAVYALARRIDDVGDEEGSARSKATALARVRAGIADLAAGTPDRDDPVAVALLDASRRYPLPLGAFDELVDGVGADAAADDVAARTGAPAAPYRTFDELVAYCRCVAGSVGRLCLGVFGPATPGGDPGEPTASRLADTLGIALQQTNILRDIREDLVHGRIYLPTEELAAHGVVLALDDDGRLADPDGGLADLIRDSARRAETWYEAGLGLLPLLDRRSAACTAAMAGIYRGLLTEIAADPTSVYDRRRSLPARRKVAVAARALLGHPTRGGRR